MPNNNTVNKEKLSYPTVAMAWMMTASGTVLVVSLIYALVLAVIQTPIVGLGMIGFILFITVPPAIYTWIKNRK